MKKIEPLFPATEPSHEAYSGVAPPFKETENKVRPLFPQTTTVLPHPKVYSPQLDRVLNEHVPEVTIERPPVAAVHAPDGRVVQPLFANSKPAAVIDPNAKIVPVVLDLPGAKLRRRWEPSIDELKGLAPEIQDPAAFNRARNIIGEVTDTTVFNEFGLEYQQRHANSATQMLVLSSDPLIKRVGDGIRTITSMVDRHVGIVNRWINQDSHVEAVTEAAKQLQQDILDCATVRKHVEGLAAGLPEIGLGIASHRVAGKYLLMVLPEGSSKVTLEKRTDSLVITSIANGQMRLQLQIWLSTMDYRQQVVLDTVVNLVPIWCQNRSMASTAEAKTVTQKILENLKHGV